MPDAETNQREMDAYFKSVVENMPVAIAVYKAVDNGNDFIITAFNKFASNIEKVDGKSILGMKITGAFPGVRKFGLLDVIHSVWKTGKSQHFPSTLYRDKRISGWRDNYVFRLPCGEVVAAYFDTSEQKFAEERLRESEEKFKGLFENAADGIVIADIKKKKFVMCNPGFSKMLGLSHGEYLCMGVSDIHPKKDLPFVLQQFDALARKEIKVAYNIPVLRKDGRILYADINAFPIIISNKKYLVGAFRNTTERKEKEERIMKNEEIYTTLAANIPGIVYRVFLREKNKMVFFNNAVEKLTGYNVSELVKGKVCSIDPLIVPADKKRIITIVEGAVKRKIPFEVEYRIKNKKGETRYFIERGMPVYGADKKPLYIDGVIFDKTERKKEQDSLADRERRYRYFFDEGQALNHIVLKDGTIKKVNKAVLKQSNYSEKDLVGRNFIEFAVPEDRNKFRKLIIADFAQKRKKAEEIRLAGNGGVHTLLFNPGTPLLKREGMPPAILLSGMDITELREARQEISKEKEQRLEQLETFKQIAVGRELKMIELKKRIAELEEQLKARQ